MNTNPARVFQLSALSIAAFAAAMTVKAPEANAIVYCVEGVYRAGCVARRRRTHRPWCGPAYCAADGPACRPTIRHDGQARHLTAWPP